MEIDIATTNDIPKLIELLQILFSQEAEFAPKADAQERALTKIISEPDMGDILVARTDDQIVGMLNLLYTISTALGDRVALLEDMVVSPNARGQSIGSNLLGHAIEFAREKGCKRITLLTDSDNIEAHNFYQKHGFTKSNMIPFRLPLKTENN